ncbi:MAG: hypothetical protein WDO68_21655 [Gammaproteobacteria bacterium]
METATTLVRVLGIGHLAAAVRVYLHHLRPPASDMDCWINSERAALFLACSDFENTPLRHSLTERARADRSTVLFACLHGRTARVGPLITPFPNETPYPHHLTRSWDFSPETSLQLPTHLTDTRQTHLAQIGASFIIGELAKILFDRVTKIDPPPNSSARNFPELHSGTLVVTRTIGWREACHLPPRIWHFGIP